jgi:hypothetical protein
VKLVPAIVNAATLNAAIVYFVFIVLSCFVFCVCCLLFVVCCLFWFAVAQHKTAEATPAVPVDSSNSSSRCGELNHDLDVFRTSGQDLLAFACRRARENGSRARFV